MKKLSHGLQGPRGDMGLPAVLHHCTLLCFSSGNFLVPLLLGTACHLGSGVYHAREREWVLISRLNAAPPLMQFCHSVGVLFSPQNFLGVTKVKILAALAHQLLIKPTGYGVELPGFKLKLLYLPSGWLSRLLGLSVSWVPHLIKGDNHYYTYFRELCFEDYI